MSYAWAPRGLLVAALIAPIAIACADRVVGPEPAVSAQGAEFSASTASHIAYFERDGLFGTVFDCNGVDEALTNRATLLCRAGPGTPVVDTDGQHITLGKWAQVMGRLAVRCVNRGTFYGTKFRHLVPNGVYTIWNFIFVDGELVAAGPLGASDGSQNAFQASAAGEGHISLVVPEGTLFPNGAAMPGCARTDLSRFILVAAYHMDGLTYGSGPGPAATQAFHASVDVTN